MGICCTGKISKTEYRNKEIIRNQRHTPQTGISPKIEPSLSFDINNSPLNTNINLLISECQNSHYNFKVSKINFDLLWNIVIEYKYDYTSCNYIIKEANKDIKCEHQPIYRLNCSYKHQLCKAHCSDINEEIQKSKLDECNI